MPRDEDGVVQDEQAVERPAGAKGGVADEEEREAEVVERQDAPFADAVDELADGAGGEVADDLHDELEQEHDFEAGAKLFDEQEAGEGDGDLFAPAFKEAEQIIERVFAADDEARPGVLMARGMRGTRRRQSGRRGRRRYTSAGWAHGSG